MAMDTQRHSHCDWEPLVCFQAEWNWASWFFLVVRDWFVKERKKEMKVWIRVKLENILFWGKAWEGTLQSSEETVADRQYSFSLDIAGGLRWAAEPRVVSVEQPTHYSPCHLVPFVSRFPPSGLSARAKRACAWVTQCPHLCTLQSGAGVQAREGSKRPLPPSWSRDSKATLNLWVRHPHTKTPRMLDFKSFKHLIFTNLFRKGARLWKLCKVLLSFDAFGLSLSFPLHHYHWPGSISCAGL